MSPLSGVLGEAWELYKRYAAHFLPIAFVIYLVVAVVAALLSLAGTFGTLAGGIFSVFGSFLVTAALVKAVQDVRDGRVDLDLQSTVRAALPYVGAVALASILAAIAIGIGLILLIIPGLILMTFWSLIVPWIVVGGSGAMDSFAKSWRTVKGYFWNVFGTYVVAFLILLVAEIVISVILVFLPLFARSLLSNVISGTLVAPYTALVVTLVYYRLTAAHGETADPDAPGEAGGPATDGGFGAYGGGTY
jgi:hypothetical protein